MYVPSHVHAYIYIYYIYIYITNNICAWSRVPGCHHPPPPHGILTPRAFCDNSHRDRAVWGHGPHDGPRFRRMGSTSRYQTVKSRWDWTFCCHVLPDSRKYSTCRATSHLKHGIGSWHVLVIVMRMIVFEFVEAGCGKRFAPEQNPLPKPQRRRG